MRFLLVLAVTVSVLLAFGVACGDDEEKAQVVPTPASESEGEAEEEEAEERDGEGADDDDDGVADEDGDGVPDDDGVAVDIREVDFSEVLEEPWCTNGCMGMGGIAEEFIEYADLTGDGQEEAIVPVHSGGTAGFIALWVYGYVDGDLQVLLALEDMYNGGARVEDSRLIVVQPVYGSDDPNCCPSQLNNTYYEWDGSELALVGEETIDNPDVVP